VRLFLAINLEPAMRRSVIDATAPLREAAPSLGWMDESRLHLTLKFLGERSDALLEPLKDAMTTVASAHRSFPMRVAEVGAFPNFRRARVVWMGIGRDPRLEILHHDVEVACERLGLALEGRAFRPHLTLARVRDKTDVEELRRLSRAGKRLDFEGESVVHSIDIMKSNLDRASAEQGGRYERLHAARLRGEN
jgi:RNA 2',3'-cyclic 3'-phosphodiesterase